MPRKAFYIYQHTLDYWRANQIRQMGVIQGHLPVTDQRRRENMARKDHYIQKWLDEQMRDKSVAIVLIGHRTANRKWINYEIEKAWKDKKGLLGIYVHRLKDQNGDQSKRGYNPFRYVRPNGKKLEYVVPTYEPPYSGSAHAYAHIRNFLLDWIEHAIAVRKKYP